MTTETIEFTAPNTATPFVERRGTSKEGAVQRERRQFADSHEELSPEARELAVAIDSYKLANRRRFITYEEMVQVLRSIGYTKQQ